MSNDITITNDMSVADLTWSRETKRGTVTRGIAGVMASGNKAERLSGALEILEKLANNNNWQAVMVDVSRVFTPSSLKTSKTSYNKETGTLYFHETAEDGKITLAPFGSGHKVTKSIALAYFAAIVEMADAKDLAGKPLKGEKRLIADFAEIRIDSEAQRIAKREQAALTA